MENIDDLLKPNDLSEINNKFGEMYFLMSSILPISLKEEKFDSLLLNKHRTGIVINTDIKDILYYLNLVIKE